MEQITSLVEVPLVDRDARRFRLPASEVLRREVYTKQLKGQTLDVTWTVTNIGTRDTRESFRFDRVYLSLDASLDSTDQLIGEFRHDGAILAKGDFYMAGLNVGLPDGISGKFNVLVFTDSNVSGALPPGDPGVRLESRFVTDPVLARVGEFRDEGDNIAAAPLTVFLTDPADLRVTSVQTPERATAGQSFTLTYTVTNSGAAATPARQPEWDDFFYLSRDEFLDLQADVFLGSERHHGILEAEASYQITRNLKLPRGLTGTFFVFAVTDPVRFADRPRGEVFEGLFEKNNATAGAVPLIITLPPPADLVADTVSIPISAHSGEPLTVTWTVSNHGTFAAEGTWSDTAYLSEDAIWDINDKPLSRVAHQGTLAPGESYTGTLRTNLPPVTPGTYRVIVRPDIFDEVFEGPDEANNKTASAGTLRVTVDDLPLDVPLRTTLNTGQERLYQIAVGLGQTLRVDLTTPSGSAANQLFIRRGRLPSDTLFDAASSGTLRANGSITVASTQDDVYYLLVRGQSEPAADTPITLFAHLLPFGITDVVTDRGGDSRFVTTTIFGAQFDPQAIVKLVRPGFAELEPGRYQVIDSTKIIAIFDFRDAPHGLYDLKVINSDKQEAIIPYRYLVERALEPDVTIGLGGPRVLDPGQVGTYSVSLQSLTNIDTPYVFFQFGLPELGINPLLFGLKYVAFTSNLRGQPDDATLANVPWASLDSAVNTTGEILAPGYALDVPTRGFTGLTFNAHTYPGLNEILDHAKAAFQAQIDQFYAQYRGLPLDQIDGQLAAIFDIAAAQGNPLANIDPEDIAFKFHISASATSLTRDEFIAQQKAEALRLRDAILADTTASQALTVLAADPAAWTDLYLAALHDAGLLRPDDQAPPVRQSPKVISLLATLASGILAGPAGDQIITDGNLVGFFEEVRRWYGNKDGLIGNAAPPAPEQFDLGVSHPTHFEAFNIFVPFGDVHLDEPGLVQVAPPDFASFFSAPGAGNSSATLVGPLGFGSEQFLPVNQPLPYTVRFQNASNAASAVGEVRVVTQLDPNLDPRSLRLGDLKLGDITVHVLDSRGSFQGDFDFTRSKGFILRVSAGIDVFSSTATWLLQAIDPNTGEVLDDAARGLLPPNNAQGAGSGFVTYTVEPNSGLPTGTQITASGRVLFNTSPPQDTETLTQTLDAVAPTTTLTATPLMEGGSDIEVNWQTVDDVGGSGVKHVTVYVSEDGGDFAIWLRQTTDTSAVYQGRAGHRYEFLALATDSAGNQEKPPSGVQAPDDGSSPNVGALPSVDATTQDFGPSAPPSVAPSVNPLFVEAQQAIPAAQPTSRVPEFSTVVRPFTSQAFATGISQSHANIGPMAIAILPDHTVLASGGPTRGQLFRFSAEGGEASAPLASLPFPIFDMAFDLAGNLWATTGGGPLVQLDAKTGEILGEFGDGITQSLAVDPASGRIFVSSGNGIEVFDPDARRFSHYSDVRVGNLAFAPDGSLWGAVCPKRGDVIRFAPPSLALRVGKPDVMLHFDDDVDSLAFGQPGTSLEGLLFISHNNGPASGGHQPPGSELTLVDLATLRHIAIATRGDIVKTSADGRIFLSQSHQIDVFTPVGAPRVVAVNPPADARVAPPLGTVTVTFDRAMFVGTATDPRSVLNAANYRLVDENGNEAPVQGVAYDEASHTAVVTFDTLNDGRFAFQVMNTVQSAEGLPLAEVFGTQFEVIADLTVVLSLEFSHARSDRADGTVSYDVAVTNISSNAVILPLILELDPQQQFDGVPQNAAGQTPDGKWLIDLSDSLPANGLLRAGQTTQGRTITVRTTGGQRVSFDPSVTGQPMANTPPNFVSQPVVKATVGEPFTYQAVAEDADSDAVSYLLLQPPDGMSIDPITGAFRWTPTVASPGRASVVLQVYDAHGGHATQLFAVQVDGVNQEPVWSASQPIVNGTEGEPILLAVVAADADGDPLTYWVDNLPPGAAFDPNRRLLAWTPDFTSAGTYENVRFIVSDGLHEVSQFVTFLIAPGNKSPTLIRPADRTVREGETLRIQLSANDLEGAPLTFTSNLLPGGATLDARTGLFEWTPAFFQHGVHKVPFIVSDGQSRTVQTTTITVLNVNAAPEFDGLDLFQIQEGQRLRFRDFAFDPDNPSFVPQDRLEDGSLTDLEGTLPTVSYTASDLPAGATFDPVSGFFDWTPSFTDAGVYDVTFTATDDGDGTGLPLATTRIVLLRVLNSNRTPEITASSNQQVKRGDVLEVPIQATDADSDPLKLSIAGLPRFATFTDHGDGTGLLRFAPGIGDRDHYTITVLASDDGDGGGVGGALTASQDFVLTVPVPNEAPHLAIIGDKVAVFGQALTFSIRASDFDQDPLTFLAEGLPSGATLTSGPAYGKATFTWTPTAADAGTYSITFQVQDSGNGDASLAELDNQTIRVIARATNSAPVLNPIGNRTITEGESLVLQLTAHDPDGDTLLYSAANLPLGATFDPVQGILRWTPNLFQAGSYPGIVFSASDGNRASTETIAIQVTNVNQAPVLVPLPIQSGRKGTPLQFTLIAADFDGDPLSVFALSPLPAGARFDSATRQFQWTPTFDQAGTYTLRFGAQDPSGLRGTVDVVVRIDNVNRAPTISVSNHADVVGQPLSFFVVGSDPDAQDHLTFSAVNLPEGATLDPLTGRFQWTPGPGQTGEFTVAFSVSDGQANMSRSAIIRADITPVSPEVTLELTPSFAVVPGQRVLVHVQASSLAQVKALALTLDGQAVSLDAQARASILAPATGRHVLEATAMDADGLVGKASGVLRVRDPQDKAPPVVSFAPELDGSIVTTATDIRATIADNNLDSWALERAPLGFGAFTTLVTGSTPVTDGVLVTLDPATLANGVYRLRLTAVDLSGRVGKAEIVVQVNSAIKPTQFQRSETDLTVVLGGVSVDLVRFYDSLRADQSSSIGLGWRLANRDVLLQTDVPPTGREASGLFNPFHVGTRVYLTLPDGRRVGFAFAPEKHEQTGVTFYTPAFAADPGVDYTLRSADALLTLATDHFFDLRTARAYHPASGLFQGPEYTLTAPDGTIYYLSSDRGVERQIMPNGMRLIYSDGGILSSNGESVRFIRDAGGRLISLIAPDGREVLYSYDAAGNLTKVSRLFSGEVMHYGYAADDRNRLNLVVAPEGQPSEAIRYAPNPLFEPITANLGSAFQFQTKTQNGSLAAGSVDRYAFALRDSELQSTKTGRILVGAFVQSTGGFQPGVPTIAGHAPLTSRLTTDSAFALFALDLAGFQLLEIASQDANASGAYTLHLFVAGELTSDGLVDGRDSEQVVTALGSAAGDSRYRVDADFDRSGTIDASDVQILASNFGFVANQPPQVKNGSAKTHQDLEVRVALADLASDPDGDPVYFRVLGAQHGTARLSGDGLSVQFTPDLGFTGQASFQFVATDCFGTSDAATVTLQVSDAPLVALDFAERNPQLQAGESRQLIVIGDFADETGVVLPGSYVTFTSTNPTSVVVSSTGQIAARHNGFGAILVSSHGQQAATAFRVGTPTSPADILLAGIGLDVFPTAVSLADHGGTRQFELNFLGGRQIASAADGTQYYVSDPKVISVSPDGLITGSDEGTAVVTVVHRGSEVLVPAKVQAPSVGPTMVGREGGVVEGEGGLRVMVAPGALNRDVQVSIKPLALSDLPIPPPPADKGFFFGAAFRLDTQGTILNVPAQFAIPVPTLTPGMPVIFYRLFDAPNADGTKTKVWLEVDDGVVGADGMARTASPPEPGPAREGEYGVVAYDIGQVRAMRGHIVAALPLAAIAGATLAITPLGGAVAIAAFAGLAGILLHVNFGVIPVTIKHISSGQSLVTDTMMNMDVRPGSAGTFQTTIFNAFDVNGTDPVITSTRVDISQNDDGSIRRELVLKGLRFAIANGENAETLPGDVQVVLEPGGFVSDIEPRRVFLDPIDVPEPSDGEQELRVDIPQDVVIGVSKIFVRRKTTVFLPGPDGELAPQDDFVESNEARFEPDGRYVFAALADSDQVAVMANIVAQGEPANELIARIGVGSDDVADRPRFVAATSDNTRAYVTLRGSGKVAVIDRLALREVDTIPDDPMDPDTQGVNDIDLGPGASPFGIVIDRFDRYAYVTDDRPTSDMKGVIYVIDISPQSDTYNQLVAKILADPAPSGLRGLAISHHVDPNTKADDDRLFVAAPKRTLFGGPDQSSAPGNILVIDISNTAAKIADGIFPKTQTIEVGQEPFGITVARKDLIAFTDRAVDGQGFGVLKDEDGNHNWKVSHYVDMTLGVPNDVLDVNNAQAIAFSPDLKYAFVSGFDRYVFGLNSADPFLNPLNPAGGNIGIIYNPFNLDFQDSLAPRDPMIPGIDPEDVNAKLIAATRPTPLSFPDNLVVSPDNASCPRRWTCRSLRRPGLRLLETRRRRSPQFRGYLVERKRHSL